MFRLAVGFTTKASNMSAHGGELLCFLSLQQLFSMIVFINLAFLTYFSVVSMLNDIFSRFDHLCEFYDLSMWFSL
jgi:hypothetical protein